MKGLLTLSFVLFIGVLQAQVELLDSLYQVPKSKRDTAWSDATIVAAYRVIYNNPNITDSVCRDLFEFGEKMGYEDRLSQIRIVQGVAKDVLNQIDSAIYFYQSGFEIAEQTGDTGMMASAYNNIGLIYWNSERLDSALIYYEMSEDLFRAIDRKRGLSSTLNNIGLIYQSMERYEESIEYFNKLLKITDNGDEDYFRAIGLQNIGQSYGYIGKYDSAYYCFLKSRKLYEAMEDKFGLSKSYHALGTNFISMDSLEQSEANLLKAIELNTELENEHSLASNYLVLSSAYDKMGESEKRLKAVLKAKELFPYFDDEDLKRKIETELYFEKIEAWDSEISSALRNVMSRKDSLYKARLEGKVLRLQEEYEAEKKDQELQIANLQLIDQERAATQRGRLIGGLVAFIVVLVAFGLLFVNYRNKLNRLRTQQRIAEERSRISRDLHDNIGAQLTAMSTRIDLLETSDERAPQLESIRNEAADTVSMLRDTIWAMHREEFTVEQFMARLRQYAQRVLPKSIGFDLKYDARLNKEPLNSSEALNLFRVAQEAIQNSTKHSEATLIEITLIKNSDQFEFSISDNGKGSDMGDLDREDSYGLQNIRERSAEIHGVANFATAEGEGFTVRVAFQKN
jgi:signal transduction histidine kinase